MDDLKSQVEENIKDLPNYDYLLGKGLLQPFNPANSGSRKLMHAIHLDHFLVLKHGEMPIIQTGFENEFGRNSSSYKTSDYNFRVLYKIPKFSFRPDVYYYLILQNIDTGEYDVMERVFAKHNTESYGYLYDNSYLDSLKEGSIIHSGDAVRKSVGFDEDDNRLNGCNLVTCYLASDKNMEDGIIISDEAADKLSTILIDDISITINDNDILLNRYGDDNNYKAFPDIGEDIKDNIFCSIKRIENDNVLYSLSRNNLKESNLSDKNIIIEGTVIDVNINCNNPEILSDSMYNSQLNFYYNENLKFSKALYDAVAPLKMQGKLSYNLNKLYAKCRDTIGGKQFFKDKPFNNVIMDVKIARNLPAEQGDKMTDRYGGKGVISKIVPKEMMPQLDNGTYVEVIKNQSTCINRENLGQLYEQSLTFIASRILDYCRIGALTFSEQAHLIYDFIYEIEPSQAEFMRSGCNLDDEYEAKVWVDMYLDDDCIVLSIPPYTNNITIDKLREIYNKFSWIKPYEVTIPIKGSDGSIRRIPTRRPLVVGKIYNYRLKQYAEEKFSVTSLAATNVKNLNTKSRANKLYEAKCSKTPIMFGAMESGNLGHIGMQYVVMQLMLYSSSPQGRRLFESLLTGDPYDINIKLDKDSKNRNAEIINTIFKTMGLRLCFSKVPKEKKMLCHQIMCRLIDEQKTNEPTKYMCKEIMCKIIDEKSKEENDNI